MSDLRRNEFAEATGLTPNEGERYLKTGNLPANYVERVGVAVQLFREGTLYCSNCGGRKCMDCLRYVHDECEDSCPFCCGDEG